MQVSRVVKISINDPDGIWKDISRYAFSDFIFQIPSQFPSISFNEEGANVFLEFVNEDSKFLQYSQIGADPYIRPYLFILAVKVKSNKPIEEKTIHVIQHWVAQSAMTGANWCVFIFQEASFFDGSKLINKAELVSEPEFQNQIFVIPCKKNTKLNEQSIDIIRAHIRDSLLISFSDYEEEVRKRIGMTTVTPSLIPKLRAWRALLLFYYGFTENARKAFMEAYNTVIGDLGDPTVNPIPPINPDWISSYPVDDGTDVASVVNFALSGAMAACYTRTKFNKALEIFMRHWGIVSEKCTTRVQMLALDEWAEKSINNLLQIPDFTSSVHVHARLLCALYYVQLGRNAKEVDDTKRKFLRVLPPEYEFSRIAADVRFVKWAGLHSVPLPFINPRANFWKFGIKATSLKLESAFLNKDYSAIIEFAQILLDDKSPYEDKEQLLVRLSSLKREVHLNSPFGAKIELSSDAFCGNIMQGEPVTAKFKLTLPSWISVKTKSLTVAFSHAAGRAQSVTLDHQPKMIIKTHFMDVGDWRAARIIARWGNGLSVTWPVVDEFARFRVMPLERPPAYLDFPKLTGILKAMKFSLTIDFTKIAAPEISLKVGFAMITLKISNQTGKAKFYRINESSEKVEEKVPFKIFDGVIKFGEEGNISPAGSLVKLQLEFQQTAPADNSEIVLATSIDGISFEQRFPVSFKFPIECSIRLRTQEFVHIRLHSTIDVPLTITSADLQPDAWGELLLAPGSDIYLLGHRSGSPLNLFVREESGSTIAQSWDVDSLEPAPVIEIEADSPFIVGEATMISFDVPEGCFEIGESPEFVLVGSIKRRCKEGRVSTRVIPIASGSLKLPSISINGVLHRPIPMFVDVIQTTVPAMVPFV